MSTHISRASNPLVSLFKKTYGIVFVLVGVFSFFFIYNTYLVDHSLVNLKVALRKLNDVKTVEDAKRLASALDYTLVREASASQAVSDTLSKIEMVKDVLAKPENMAQVQSMRGILENVVKEKEQKRPAMLVALDTVVQAVAPSGVQKEASAVKLIARTQSLQEKISNTKNKGQLQELYFELASTFMQNKKFDDAKKAYLNLIEIAPETKLAGKAMFSIAWNEKHQGNYVAALQEFEKLIAMPGVDRALLMSAKYELADTYKKKGDHLKAAELFKELISLSEAGDAKGVSSMALLQTGNIYLYGLNDITSAQEFYDQAKESVSLEASGPSDSGLARYVETIAQSNISGQYRREGFRFLNEGYKNNDRELYRQAIAQFTKALEVDANDGISFSGRALGYLWLKDPDKAMWDARKAVKLMPNDEIASVNLGYIYIQLNIADEAISEYKRFIAVNPFTFKGYYNLGYAYLISGKFEEAAAAFDQAYKIDNTFTRALNNQAWCFWQLGQYAKAVEIFERAILKKPGFLDPLFNVAVCYKSMGRHKDSKERFLDLIRMNPNYPGVNKHLQEIDAVLLQQEQ